MTMENRSRQILIHGIAFVLAGLVWGLAVPLTPHPRLALTAHIQATSYGLLFIAAGILLWKLPHRVGPKSIILMLAAAWLAWPMVASQAANAWWGTTQTLSIAAAQSGVTGGTAWQEMLLKLTHIPGSLVLIAAWTGLLIGFVERYPVPKGQVKISATQHTEKLPSD